MPAGLLKGALSSGEHTKVLVDGFPRVLEQLHDFEQQVREAQTWSCCVPLHRWWLAH
jgi:adenylate kinase family enzyme